MFIIYLNFSGLLSAHQSNFFPGQVPVNPGKRKLKCQIRVKEFAELAGVETDALYLELRDTARSVRSKELILENIVKPGEERPRRKYISWFIDVSVDPNGDGYIGVTLHPDLKPYLLQVHRDYTRFQIGYAVRMESKYAIRLYQLLQRWAFVGKKRITVDELRPASALASWTKTVRSSKITFQRTRT